MSFCISFFLVFRLRRLDDSCLACFDPFRFLLLLSETIK